ncbi:lamin tail domain-containing protein, partial [Flavobacterium silvaticum]
MSQKWITAIFVLLSFSIGQAQIYLHDFGSTAISTHPYTVNPMVLDTHLSGSSWTNSVGIWSSNTGSTGEAIRLTTATSATITLTFSVASNFAATIDSFSFWSLRSNLGPQNWSMTVNGTSVGSGTTGTTGASTGTLPVSTAITGLTGTVTVVISLSGQTGNGTYRLDDFRLNGSVVSNCTAATISTIFPLTGPEHTLVTISGSGFMAGTTDVLFNGIASVFEVVSDTEIKAYAPTGGTTGSVSVITNGCEGFSSQTFTDIESVAVQNYASDLYISELYDAQAGDGGVIELYNGTASPIDLSGYTIRRYGDVGGPTFYTIILTGIIMPGEVFLIGIGNGVTPCSISENMHYPTGFNSNDEFVLYNGATIIDDVHAPVNVGYSVIRNVTAIGPNPVFNSADWNTNTTEDCSDIGIHNVPSAIPQIATAPASVSDCADGLVVFSTSLPNPAGFTYQWKLLDASGNWVNITNAAPFSGANTPTLTINPAGITLDNGQFYCQMISTTSTVVSNAAQLELTPAQVADFSTSLILCNGSTAPVLNNISPNGITGSWSPATVSNTTSGNYVFTPDAGQCASPVTLSVTVTNSIVPDFAAIPPFCSGSSVP